MSEEFDSSGWLKSYLQSVPHDLDVDVLSEYISAIFEEVDATETTMCTEIESLLAAYLPDAVCKQCTSEIIQHFTQHTDPTSSVPVEQGTPAGNVSDDGNVLLKMEEQMRALMQADYEKQRKAAETRASEHRRMRDACTTAVLREAGVSGYQGDSEEEKDVEIAITNAAFQAKQLLDTSSSLNVAPELNGATDSTEDAVDSELDLQNLVDISGYGSKDGAKPGTVEDALSVLNPSLFGSSMNKPLFPPGATRLPTPGPRPMGFRISGCIPSAVSPASSVVVCRPAVEDNSATTGGSQRKKKPPAPSKHIAKVGALAEAKSKSESKRVTNGAADTAVRARQEEMASFLFSDSDGDAEPAPLPEGAKNRERVIAAEQTAREVAAVKAAQRRTEEKVNREQQLAQQAKRKQAAQQKAQKVERRR